MNRALKKILLVALTAALSFVGRDALPRVLADQQVSPTLRVEFLPQFNGAPLAFDALTNQISSGQTISVTRLDFLVSNFALRETNGIWIEKKNFFAFICGRDGITNFTLENIPVGNYNAIRFHIGLPPQINHS